MSGNFSFVFSSEDLFFLLTFSPSHCGGIIFQVKVTQIQVSGFPGMLTLRCSLMTWSLLALANLDRSPPQTLGLMLILTSFPEATPIMPLSIDHSIVYLLLSMALWASTLKYQQLTIWLGEWNFGRDQRRDYNGTKKFWQEAQKILYCKCSPSISNMDIWQWEIKRFSRESKCSGPVHMGGNGWCCGGVDLASYLGLVQWWSHRVDILESRRAKWYSWEVCHYGPN